MATVSMHRVSEARPNVQTTHVPYVAERVIDFATATTIKGSALAVSDVIEALYVPAGSVVLAAGMTVVSARVGTSTDLTFDLGITGVDDDNFVDGWDYDAAAAGSYPQQPAAHQPIVVGAAGDTIDLLIATQTGTLTGGRVRVWALIADVSPKAAPGVTNV